MIFKFKSNNGIMIDMYEITFQKSITSISFAVWKTNGSR